MCFYTLRLGRLVPSCWVAPYPARWVAPYPFAGYKTDYEQLQGLFKRRLNPEPVVAAVVVHGDGTTGEVQVVRAVAVPRVST